MSLNNLLFGTEFSPCALCGSCYLSIERRPAPTANERYLFSAKCGSCGMSLGDKHDLNDLAEGWNSRATNAKGQTRPSIDKESES